MGEKSSGGSKKKDDHHQDEPTTRSIYLLNKAQIAAAAQRETGTTKRETAVSSRPISASRHSPVTKFNKGSLEIISHDEAQRSAAKQQIAEIVRRLLGCAFDPCLAMLSVEEINTVLVRSREALMNDGPMIEMSAPVVIVGDLHGQFADAVAIFEQNGKPPGTRYLFLGDYVDRGEYSIETVILLLSLKLLHPDAVFLLRGNHECRAINRAYGFYDEVTSRFNHELWLNFQLTFNCLPLSARIDKRMFCMHGGLSRDLTTWKMMADIKRPLEVPTYGLLCDLLWADPSNDVKLFGESARGISCTFGAEYVVDFCKDMDLDLVVRAHQVVMDGYEFFAGRKLVTIFSAPYYCKDFGNAGGVLSVSKDLECRIHIRHPKGLPENEDEAAPEEDKENNGAPPPPPSQQKQKVKKYFDEDDGISNEDDHDDKSPHRVTTSSSSNKSSGKAGSSEKTNSNGGSNEKVETAVPEPGTPVPAKALPVPPPEKERPPPPPPSPVRRITPVAQSPRVVERPSQTSPLARTPTNTSGQRTISSAQRDPIMPPRAKTPLKGSTSRKPRMPGPRGPSPAAQVEHEEPFHFASGKRTRPTPVKFGSAEHSAQKAPEAKRRSAPLTPGPSNSKSGYVDPTLRRK
uniref:Serine/threonine-protein phosphatase n=1 Tax=Panagrellus redivivus TaxID=6233 RepID=A0A7E4URF9_PANRE